MKAYFRYMASVTGRTLRVIAGIMVVAWGYSLSVYPYNIWMMAGGAVYAVLGVANLSLFAPLGGYSIYGRRIIDKYGEITGLPGEKASYEPPKKHIAPMDRDEATINDNDRAQYHTGSTTQGGSNFGQGSAGLGPESYAQGREKNSGANYENEQQLANKDQKKSAEG